MLKKPDQSMLDNPNATVLLLNALLQKIALYTQHIDVQNNITVALSGAIFVFAASRISQEASLSISLFVLAFFSGVSALTALFAVNPPTYLKKRGQKESLFYHSSIAKYSSPQHYYEDFNKMLQSEEKYIREVTKEIYNMSRYSYLPKNLLAKLARSILAFGFLLSFLVFVLHTFLKLF